MKRALSRILGEGVGSSSGQRGPQNPICGRLPDLMIVVVHAPGGPGSRFSTKAQGSQGRWRETSVNPHTVAPHASGSLGSQGALNPSPKGISDSAQEQGTRFHTKQTSRPHTRHTLHLLTFTSEGDVHQPLIKFLDLPEVVDHLSRGRVLHPCAVQGCLQIRQLRGKSRNTPHGQSDAPLPDLEGKDHQISPPRPGGRPLRKQWGSQKLPLPCACLSDGARRARVSSHCLPTSWGCRKGSCCQILID